MKPHRKQSNSSSFFFCDFNGNHMCWILCFLFTQKNNLLMLNGFLVLSIYSLFMAVNLISFSFIDSTMLDRIMKWIISCLSRFLNRLRFLSINFSAYVKDIECWERWTFWRFAWLSGKVYTVKCDKRLWWLLISDRCCMDFYDGLMNNWLLRWLSIVFFSRMQKIFIRFTDDFITTIRNSRWRMQKRPGFNFLVKLSVLLMISV